MRLDKFLAQAADLSRSDAKKYIKSGRVSIEGYTRLSPDLQIEPGQDKVFLDEKELVLNTGFKYFILNKPAGVITATEDKQHKTVLDLLVNEKLRDVSPVGRLDKDTEGLLLLTDDGDLNHQLMSPKKHVEKEYYVRVDGMLSDEDVVAFSSGMDIGDEKPLKPAVLKIISSGQNESEASVVISEGRYHQIKRMFAKRGFSVTFLKRLRIGNYYLPKELKPGEYISIGPKEIEQIRGY